jgi:hypothetical protein
VNGARQCVSIEQVLRQVSPPHRYGEQLDAVGARQPPLPLQCEMGVKVDPEHDWVPHDTVVAASWQAPAPLHAPVLPQGGFGVHRFIVSRVPAGTFAQLPAAAPTLHDWQRMHELVAQQTPSTQKLPVRHSAVDAHGCPRRFSFPQWLVCGSQMLGGRQSLSAVQTPRQAVEPLQTYGAHACVVAVWQTPRPLHVLALTWVD